jgi:hypothetical protein
MKKIILLALLHTSCLFAQTTDELFLKQMHTLALTDSNCYGWLDDLSNKIGHRLSGSKGAELAVSYTQSELKKLDVDKVYLQAVKVPKWERGAKEQAYLQLEGKKIPFSICALGLSVATPQNGLVAPVIEVQSLDQLTQLGEGGVKGKIVFFNRPMNPEFIETFHAYGSCVDQRSSGAREAGKLGALGVIVRSMNLRIDDLPHTGMTNYGDTPMDQRIPAAAISTLGANQLSALLKDNPNATFYFKQSCQNYDEVLSHNVIAEITGSVYPNQIMVVGGHLDSWDLGDGSHDDGAGCVQSMTVLQLFKKMNYKPKHTVRVVLFMNEENGVKGGMKYEEMAVKNKEQHVFALESDSGGFSPRGFSIEATPEQLAQIQSWESVFKPYLIHLFRKGHSGTDIGPLKDPNIVKVGLQPDSQRYFDYHHAANDTFDAVNKRELELGAAAMTALVYLWDSQN